LNEKGWILVVTPTKVAAQEMVSELRLGLQATGVRLELGGGHKGISSNSPTIRVVSAAQLLEIYSGQIPRSRNPHLRLVVCDGLEQLNPTYELALSLLRLTEQTSLTRFIGISASLNDASDLAKWLGVEDASIHSFRPQDRDQSLVTLRQTFSIPYSVSLIKAMVKPAHRAIQDSPPGSSVLLFVPSRGQTRSIALDLITRCTLEMEIGRGYISENISDDLLEIYCTRLQDTTLFDFVQKGIGFFHLGIGKADRLLMLEMFAEGIIRVLIVPKDACWSVPTRATVVIAMGTQYIHVEDQGTLRQIRDYTLTEVVRMQSRAIQQSGTGFFHLFCQAESLETYSRFLDEGLPLESQLLDSQTFREWVRSFYVANQDKQCIVDVLSFTLLAHRVVSNPSYYGFTTRERDQNLSAIVDQIVDEIHREMAVT
jgi:antiviral helicase SLH1